MRTEVEVLGFCCRLFSKFYSRKMQELNETGLHNLSALFLVLAQTVDLDEAVRCVVKTQVSILLCTVLQINEYMLINYSCIE